MKILVYLDENALSPAGGPLGVGYYIFNEAKQDKEKHVYFLKSDLSVKNIENKQKKILYKFPRITKIVRSIRHIKTYRRMFLSPEKKHGKFDEYDIVHFHSTKDMYEQRLNLSSYQGKVLLTSHSPIPLHQELYAACATKFEGTYFNKNLDKFKEMDKWSFENADHIVFPCPEAEEPYYNNWEEYRSIKENKKEDYRYVLTGITEKKTKVSKEDIRKKYGLDSQDFIISYVGRHNEVKGYNNLKELGKRIIEKENNIRFLIAGKEGPLYRLDSPSWIEVGFTKDPYSLISASDVFVLPNNETYFDLVMLEVLSLGKIIVASRTGGNKFFEKEKVEGVFLYDSLEEAELLLKGIKEMSICERKLLGEANKKFFDKELTSKKFFENYINTVNDILI